MFEIGEDSGDKPGEFQLWKERRHLDMRIPFPQSHHDLHYDPKTQVLGMVTGMGNIKSATATMALGLDQRFDLSHAYWLVAGIAGIDPQDASIGSAAWARYLVDGVVPPQAGNDHPYSTPMGVMQTSDGFINIGVGGDGQWQSLCQALELPGLATHPAYATPDDRFRNRPALMQLLAPFFLGDSSANLLAKLERHSVPAGPIYHMDEVFADPQVRHLGIAQTVHHPLRGDIALVGQPVGLSRTPASIRTAIPDKGEHSDAVLAEAGLRGDEIAALRQQGVI